MNSDQFYEYLQTNENGFARGEYLVEAILYNLIDWKWRYKNAKKRGEAKYKRQFGGK